MGNEESTTPSEEVKQVYSIYSRSLLTDLNQRRKSKTRRQPVKKVNKAVFQQLFESFSRFSQYRWSKQIVVLFNDYFDEHFGAFWGHDTQIFYRQMLQNSGLIQYVPIKFKSYEDEFYACEPIRIKDQNQQQDEEAINSRIHALNTSIIDESEIVPFVPFIIASKKPKKIFNKNIAQSMFNRSQPNRMRESNEIDGHLSYTSEYYDSEILTSSVIVPETVFVERLNEESKFKVSNMLNFYKIFSESLQQLVRNLSLIACPLKHFEIYLKRKVKLKNIKSSESTPSLSQSVVRDSRKQGIMRKKKEYNNSYLLVEIRDFTEAYTEFIWKYLNLYRFAETEFSAFISIETAYGVIFKLVWSFASWIGQRGYEWEERRIPDILDLMHQEHIKLAEKNKKKSFIQLEVEDYIVKLGCDLSKETNPQKYLKKIVIIYRELSKNCTNADELILYYQQLFQEIAKRKCCYRLLKMQNIIEKVLKMQDASGQICYAWTTWNIMVETIKKKLSIEENQIEADNDFKTYLKSLKGSRVTNGQAMDQLL